MDTQDFNTIVMIVYAISLLSATFALWVKWAQDEAVKKMEEILRRSEEIEKSLIKLEVRLEKGGINDPFPAKNKNNPNSQQR